MKEIVIKSKNQPICKISYSLEDEDNMGVISGQFNPLDAYDDVCPIIKQYSKLIIDLPIKEFEKNTTYTKLRKLIKEMHFLAYNKENEILEFSHIELRDFSDELGNEGYEFLLYK